MAQDNLQRKAIVFHPSAALISLPEVSQVQPFLLLVLLVVIIFIILHTIPYTSNPCVNKFKQQRSLYERREFS